jgi:hypothetical protein
MKNKDRAFSNRVTALSGAYIMVILVALTVLIPMNARSQGTPGVWVSLDVDKYLSVGQYNGISFAVEDSGVAHLSYYKWNYGNQNYDLRYGVVRGANVSSITVDQFNDPAWLRSGTRVDSLGRVHVLWMLEWYPGSELFNTSLEYYVISDKTVVERDNLTGVLGLNLQYAEFDFAVDAAGKMHIALSDFYHNVYYITNSGGTWISTLIGSLGYVGGGISLALDNSGFAHISYVEFGYTLRYATDASGNWTTTDVLSGSVFPTSCIAVDSSAHVFIGCMPDWVDSGNGNLARLGYVTNLNGTFELHRTPFYGWVGSKWLSIARDGDLRLVYRYSGIVMSTGPPLSDSQWVTQNIPGGDYVEEDVAGHLHTFYMTGSYDSVFGLVLEYASNKFSTSSAPRELVASPRAGTISLSWAAPANTSDLPITEYLVFFGSDENNMSLRVTLGPDVASYTLANLSASTWFFSVAPVTAAGVGENSSTVSATPLEVEQSGTVKKTEDHTIVVFGATAALVIVLCALSAAMLKRSSRARVFTVAFVCWAIVISSILPAYFVNASWDSVQDKWVKTTAYSGITGSRAWMMLDDRGHCHVTIMTFSGLTYLTNASGEWNASIVSPDWQAVSLSMAVDSNGFAHIAYIKGYDYSGPLYYATNKGGSWVASLVDNSTMFRECSIAVGEDGLVRIGYTGEGYKSYILKYAIGSGSSWDIETAEVSGSLALSVYDIGVDRSGDMIYQVGHQIHYATRTEDGWVIKILADGFSPVVFFDGTGTPRVSFRGGTNPTSQVLYGTEQNGTWYVEELGFSGGSAVGIVRDDSTGQVRMLFRALTTNYLATAQTTNYLVMAQVGPLNLSRTVVTSLDGQLAETAEAITMTGDGRILICSIEHSSGADRVIMYEEDVSPFTLSERLSKGWSDTQATILLAWVAVEFLTFVALLAAWRQNLLMREGDVEDSADIGPQHPET